MIQRKGRFTKDPDETLDYMVDWSRELADKSNDTIGESSWSAETGIDIEDDSNTTLTATVWLSGGTLGANYKVTNRIVTVGGRTYERTIEIAVRNK